MTANQVKMGLRAVDDWIANLAGSRTSRHWAAVGVGLCICIGLWTRIRYQVIAGGLWSDYFEWANIHYFGGITPSYTKSADAIAAGQLTKIEPLYPIGYPLLIAVGKILGFGHLQTFRIFQLTLDAVGCLLAYRVCRKLVVARPIAVLAALAYAVVPWWAWGSTVILAEAVVPLLTLLVLLLMLRARRKQRPRDWIFVGFAGFFAALVRTELTVLFLPLSIFTFLASQSDTRIRSTSATLAAFWIPWFLLAIANFWIFGRFFNANNVTYYALFSGLGQLPNSYGYYADDNRAALYLQSIGLTYHSKEAEQHWRAIYFDAWRNHPGYLLSTILHRFKLIAAKYTEYVPVYGTVKISLWPGLVVLIGSSVWLCTRQRFLDAMVISGPLLVALGSLGFIYVEPRYVRYATLSYLFGSAVFASLLLDGLRAQLPRWFAWPIGLQKLTPAIVFGSAIATQAPQLVFLDNLARQEVRRAVASDANTGPDEWRIVGGSIFQPAARGSEIQLLPNGIPRIITSPAEKGYQGIAKIGTAASQFITVEYAIEANGAGGYFGLLRGDGSSFLSQQPLAAGKITKGTTTVDVDEPSLQLVVTGTQDHTYFDVHSIKFKRTCVDRFRTIMKQPIRYLSSLIAPIRSNFVAPVAIACPVPKS